MRLCIGVYASLLCRCLYADWQNQYELINRLVKIVDCENDYDVYHYNAPNSSAKKFIERLYACTSNPDKKPRDEGEKQKYFWNISSVARRVSVNEVSKRYHDCIIAPKHIDADKKNLLVIALRKVVNEDVALYGDKAALFEECAKMSVGDFLKITEINLPHFLSVLLLYSFALAENKVGRRDLKCLNTKTSCNNPHCNGDCVIRIDDFLKRCEKNKVNFKILDTTNIDENMDKPFVEVEIETENKDRYEHSDFDDTTTLENGITNQFAVKGNVFLQQGANSKQYFGNIGVLID
jgi:hypothetical protein